MTENRRTSDPGIFVILLYRFVLNEGCINQSDERAFIDLNLIHLNGSNCIRPILVHDITSWMDVIMVSMANISCSWQNICYL